MVRFQLVDSEYPGVPALLLSRVDGFADSKEYGRLNDTEQNLPGVVAAAFTCLLNRLQDSDLREGLTESEGRTLQSAYEVLEVLSTSKDERVRTLVCDEIFDNLRTAPEGWRVIENQLGPATMGLWQVWKKKNVE